jgi:hypothetical protein
MEQSSSWETANSAATQEFHSILWNLKIYYRVYKSPPTVPTLSQINQIHTIPFYLSKIHFNIVHPPTSWSSQWSLSCWLSHQHRICIPLLPYSFYMPCPPHPHAIRLRIRNCKLNVRPHITLYISICHESMTFYWTYFRIRKRNGGNIPFILTLLHRLSI